MEKKEKRVKKFSVNWQQLTCDENGHPKLDKKFASAYGIVESVTCLREDDCWKLSIKRNRRRLRRAFVCPQEDLDETIVLSLTGKKVFLTPKLLFVHS